jgi:hypothetical protein
MMKRVERKEDMGPDGKLALIQQDDGDIIVAVYPSEEQRQGEGENSYSVEFCSPGGGGGRSRNTIQALRALIVAMERDNDEVAPEDLPVGMDFRSTPDVKDLTMILARTVSDRHGTNNGPTALYWALMATIAKHAIRQESEGRQ